MKYLERSFKVQALEAKDWERIFGKNGASDQNGCTDSESPNDSAKEETCQNQR